MKRFMRIYQSPIAQVLVILAFAGWLLGWQRSSSLLLQFKLIEDTITAKVAPPKHGVVDVEEPNNSNDTQQLQPKQTQKQELIPVFHVASYAWEDHEIKGEIKHFDWDGIMHSSHLKFESDPRFHHPQLVWIADLVLLSNKVRCFVPVLQRALTIRRQRGQPTTWPIHFLDWSDHPKLLRCPQVEQLMGKEHVFYHKRSIVSGRHWNESTNTIDLGRIEPFSDWANFSGAPIHHIPMTVRSDFVTELNHYIQRRYSQNQNGSSWEETETMNNDVVDVVDLDRPLDAVHFWPAVGGKVDRGMKGGPNNSQLRDAVSRALEELAQVPYQLSTFAGLQGKANSQGRNGVDINYIQTMLQYKIVVVAQKDNWEDHFRLFEALCSGAMVLHDQMLAPPYGLVDGESIVFYRNVKELKTKLLYYLKHDKKRLAIARKGRQIALQRHRSWHRMEEIVFGAVRSN